MPALLESGIALGRSVPDRRFAAALASLPRIHRCMRMRVCGCVVVCEAFVPAKERSLVL